MRLFWKLAAPVVTLLLPAIAHADSPGRTGGQPPALKSGANVYHHVCQACHMADATGGKGAGVVPALRNDPKLASSSWMLAIVLQGHGGMPWFNGQLSNEQIADVVNYVRSNFGNHYADAVTPEMVKQAAGPVQTDDH